MAFSLKCKPCEYTSISQPYKAGKHRGIDLVNHKLYQKTPIRAAQDGKVVAAKKGAWDWSYGNMVAIYHGNGNYTNYAHLSKICTRVGKTVKAGTIIGYMGNTGNSTGTHLHFEVHLGRKWNRVNPYPYIKNAKMTNASTSKKPKFVVGKTYVLLEDMNIRVGYPTNGKLKPKVPVSKWTAYAKKHATKNGLLRKGTRITFDDFVTVGDETWVHLKSGWMCASGSKTYIKGA